MTAALLEIEDLAVEIGGQPVVTAANLRVDGGRCVALVGESGSGKSVTCRALTGLLAYVGGRITDGSMRLGGRELATLGARDWRAIRGRELALVPQASLAGLDPVMRIGRQLAETIRLHERTGVEARSLELLEQVRMPDPERVLRSYPHQLSGGMRQRVMLALALAGRPALLVADEPTTALDVTVQGEILRLLATLREETGLAIVLVTHDLSVAAAIADEVTVMYAGMTVESGPRDQLLDGPLHPYTSALLAADLAATPMGEPVRGIPGAPPPPEQWGDECRFAPRCAFAADACRAGVPHLQGAVARQSTACVRWPEIQGGRV